MGVTVIESLAQFKEIIGSEKTAVVDFWATWYVLLRIRRIKWFEM